MLHEKTGPGSQNARERVEDEEVRGAFWVIRASAGSGKTFRLVQTYLTCCLSQSSPGFFRSICALTFTNKAAQEMKERVLEEIGHIASGAGGAMEEKVRWATGLGADVLQARAQAMREHMLHHYEDFAVMTIDSFVHRLVRSFARDLQLDQGFQIELDEDRLIEEAVDRLLARVGRPGEEELTRLLEAFVEQQVEDERDARVRDALMQHARLVDKEHMQPTLQALDGWSPAQFEAARRRLKEEIDRAEAAVLQSIKGAEQAIEAAGLTTSDFSGGAIPKWLAKARKEGRKAQPSKTALAMLRGEKNPWKAKTPPATIDAISSAMPSVQEAYDAWAAAYTGEAGGLLKLKQHVRQRMSLVGTLASLSTELQAVMAEESVQTFGSLNRQIADLVQNNPAPYIFERIGVRYRHLFIDEFQDTSVTQWHNLVSLYENVLAQGFDALVVGDGKQAIYRWRNGDLRQLEALPGLILDGGEPPEALRSAAMTLGRHFRNDQLTENWRTGSAIVEFNNRVFDAVGAALPEVWAGVYAGAAQQPMKGFEGEVFVDTLAGDNKGERAELRLDWVLQRVRHHAASRPLTDIAVLVRTNAAGAELAEFLFANGITPFTEESLQLGRHPVATSVVAMLRSLVDPFNPKHITAFLQGYAALHPDEIDEAALLEKHARRITLPSLPGDDAPRHRWEVPFVDVLRDVCAEVDLVGNSTSPIVALMGHILGALGWSNRFAAYAEGLLELAREVAERPAGGAGVHAFLRLWDRKGARRSIRVSSGTDAVRIMTVHKAKGLEFPVVIAPVDAAEVDKFRGEVPVMLDVETFGVPAGLLSHHDLTDTPLAHVQEHELGQTILDALNIAYVAWTRPVHALDIVLEFNKEPNELKEETLRRTIPGWMLLGIREAFGPEALAQGPLALGAPSVVDAPASASVSASAMEDADEVRTPDLLLGAPVRELVAMPRERWQDEARLSEQNFGRAVHALFAEIRDITEWEKQRDEWLRGPAAHSPALAAVVDAVADVLAHPVAGASFAPGADEVMLERDWVSPSGEVQRPDRVVRRGDFWTVVDFKTGAQKDAHKGQIRNYLITLAALCPGMHIAGLLVYTDSLEAVPVPFETLF